MLDINNEMSKSSINFVTIPNKSIMVHVCFVLFIVCLCICVCECLLQNNNHKTKHNNNTDCGSAFEPGASGLPYYCTSIYVRSGCTPRASCVDSKTHFFFLSLCMCSALWPDVARHWCLLQPSSWSCLCAWWRSHTQGQRKRGVWALSDQFLLLACFLLPVLCLEHAFKNFHVKTE